MTSVPLEKVLFHAVRVFPKNPEKTLQLLKDLEEHFAQDPSLINTIFVYESSKLNFGRFIIPIKSDETLQIMTKLFTQGSTILDTVWSDEFTRVMIAQTRTKEEAAMKLVELRHTLRSLGARCALPKNAISDDREQTTIIRMRMNAEMNDEGAVSEPMNIITEDEQRSEPIVIPATGSPQALVPILPTSPPGGPPTVLDDSWRIMVDGMRLPSGDPMVGSSMFIYDPAREAWRIELPQAVMPASGEIRLCFSTTQFGHHQATTNNKHFDIEACIKPHSRAIEGATPWTFQLVTQLYPKQSQTSLFSLSWPRVPAGELPEAVIMYVVARDDAEPLNRVITNQLDIDYVPEQPRREFVPQQHQQAQVQQQAMLGHNTIPQHHVNTPPFPMVNYPSTSTSPPVMIPLMQPYNYPQHANDRNWSSPHSPPIGLDPHGTTIPMDTGGYGRKNRNRNRNKNRNNHGGSINNNNRSCNPRNNFNGNHSEHQRNNNNGWGGAPRFGFNGWNRNQNNGGVFRQ